MKNSRVSKAIKVALAFGAASTLSLSSAAFAEEAEAVEDVERIEVTGSRIKRVGFESSQPIAVVTAAEMNDLGYTNVADALRNMPAFGEPGSDGQGDQSGNNVGANYANFYGLGSQRTLVLVNGRRFVSGNPAANGNGAAGLQVDLNMIPLSMVDRVEVVSVGGAPIYGSDAISGTVNIILKHDFEGFDFASSYGVSSEDDLKEKRFSITTGGNFDGGKGNATFSIEYSTKDGAPLVSRDHLAAGYQFREPVCDDGATCQYSRTLVKNARANIVSAGGVITPGGLLLPNIGFGSLGDGNFYQFGPNGDLTQYDVGQPVDNVVWSVGGEGLFLPDVENLSAPIDRLLVFSNFNYEMSDNVRAFGEFFFGQTKGVELSNQSYYQSGLFGQSAYALNIDVNHPFIKDSARQQLADLGVTDSFFLQRESRDLNPDGNGTTNKGTTWRMVTGLEGEFEFADREFSWEVYYNYGKAISSGKRQTMYNDRFFYAMDSVIADDGSIQCRVTVDPSSRPTDPAGTFGTGQATDIYDDCVPLNIFGAGAPSQAAIDYVSGLAFSESETTQEVYGATLSTSLFELPAGALDIAGGMFSRTETSDFDASGIYTTNRSRAGALSNIYGEFTVDEWYVELFAPIVSDTMDIPLVHKLSMEAAYRTMDHSTAGKDNAWTVGINYAPIEDVEIRGNVTRSVRAPAITELFSPVTPTFSFAADPCDGTINSADETAQANRVANCAAAGIDRATFVSAAKNASVQGVSGGNVNLENEVADSYSVGLVFSPRYVENLTFAVDYVSIEIEDAIEQFTLTDLMEGCYDSSSYPNNFCDTFTRGADNQLLKNDAFTSGYVNAGTTIFNAYSVDIDYSYSLEDWGDIHAGAYLFLPQQYDEILLGTTDNELGEPGFSEEQFKFVIDWRMDDFSLTLSPRYVGEVKLNNDDFREYKSADQNNGTEQKISRDILDVDAQWYLDVGATYHVTDKVMVRANVRNLFDNRSDPATVAAGLDHLYDNIGRYMSVGVNVSF